MSWAKTAAGEKCLAQREAIRQQLHSNRQHMAYKISLDEDVFPRSIAMQFIIRQKMANLSLVSQVTDYLYSQHSQPFWSKHTLKLLLLGGLKYYSYTVSKGAGCK